MTRVREVHGYTSSPPGDDFGRRFEVAKWVLVHSANLAANPLTPSFF